MGISILVVCNEQYTLDILNNELEDSGYNIQLENDIMRAAEFSKERGIFNVVLLCILPANVKSMLLLLELMKHKRPSTACIMISAVDDANIVSECLMRGAVAVLTAPLNKEKLIAAISNVLKS